MRIPPRVYDALKAYAAQRGHTLSRATADLIEATLVSEELEEFVPRDVVAYMQGRRMFAMLAGLLDAANAAGASPPPPGTNV